jgi:hypothetical protein
VIPDFYALISDLLERHGSEENRYSSLNDRDRVSGFALRACLQIDLSSANRRDMSAIMER